MGDFKVKLKSIENKFEISKLYDALPTNFFAPYTLQPTRTAKNCKTFYIIFLNYYSIKLNLYSGNY